eukprot:22485-Chlamydomonas_euryale.AAC.2
MLWSHAWRRLLAVGWWESWAAALALFFCVAARPTHASCVHGCPSTPAIVPPHPALPLLASSTPPPSTRFFPPATSSRPSTPRFFPPSKTCPGLLLCVPTYDSEDV